MWTGTICKRRITENGKDIKQYLHHKTIRNTKKPKFQTKRNDGQATSTHMKKVLFCVCNPLFLLHVWMKGPTVLIFLYTNIVPVDLTYWLIPSNRRVKCEKISCPYKRAGVEFCGIIVSSTQRFLTNGSISIIIWKNDSKYLKKWSNTYMLFSFGRCGWVCSRPGSVRWKCFLYQYCGKLPL